MGWWQPSGGAEPTGRRVLVQLLAAHLAIQATFRLRLAPRRGSSGRLERGHLPLGRLQLFPTAVQLDPSASKLITDRFVLLIAGSPAARQERGEQECRPQRRRRAPRGAPHGRVDQAQTAPAAQQLKWAGVGQPWKPRRCASPRRWRGRKARIWAFLCTASATPGLPGSCWSCP